MSRTIALTPEEILLLERALDTLSDADGEQVSLSEEDYDRMDHLRKKLGA